MPRGNKPIHGWTSGVWQKKRAQVYNAWKTMRQRCSNSRCHDFKNYGGRFITFCEDWKKFENFLADMGEPPEGMTLERIDNNGDYNKNNCRWATRTEQNLNKRNNVRYEYNGKNLTLSEWSRETGIGRLTLYKRLEAGKSIEQALNWKLWAKKA